MLATHQNSLCDTLRNGKQVALLSNIIDLDNETKYY